jgi:TolA-binding protein
MARTSRPPLATVAIVAAVVVLPLAATGQTWELIPLAFIAALLLLFWRPVRRWTEQPDAEPAPNAAGLTQQMAQLQREVERMALEHRRLAEIVRWQEQLLQRTLPAERERVAAHRPLRRRKAGLAAQGPKVGASTPLGRPPSKPTIED